MRVTRHAGLNRLIGAALGATAGWILGLEAKLQPHAPTPVSVGRPFQSDGPARPTADREVAVWVFNRRVTWAAPDAAAADRQAATLALGLEAGWLAGAVGLGAAIGALALGRLRASSKSDTD